MKRLDLIGKRFGKLIVKELSNVVRFNIGKNTLKYQINTGKDLESIYANCLN